MPASTRPVGDLPSRGKAGTQELPADLVRDQPFRQLLPRRRGQGVPQDERAEGCRDRRGGCGVPGVARRRFVQVRLPPIEPGRRVADAAQEPVSPSGPPMLSRTLLPATLSLVRRAAAQVAPRLTSCPTSLSMTGA